jgi:hypothetical protein
MIGSLNGLMNARALRGSKAPNRAPFDFRPIRNITIRHTYVTLPSRGKRKTYISHAR